MNLVTAMSSGDTVKVLVFDYHCEGSSTESAIDTLWCGRNLGYPGYPSSHFDPDSKMEDAVPGAQTLMLPLKQKGAGVMDAFTCRCHPQIRA